MVFVIFLNSVKLSKVDKIVLTLVDQYFYGYILPQAGNAQGYDYLSLFLIQNPGNEIYALPTFSLFWLTKLAILP